jgi:hypothetical protein
MKLSLIVIIITLKDSYYENRILENNLISFRIWAIIVAVSLYLFLFCMLSLISTWAASETEFAANQLQNPFFCLIWFNTKDYCLIIRVGISFVTVNMNDFIFVRFFGMSSSWRLNRRWSLVHSTHLRLLKQA